MKSIIILLVVAYLAICLRFYFFQRSFLYLPQPAGHVQGGEPVSFDNGQQNLSGWVLNPGKKKALIYYGGNAETVENNAEFFRRVASGYSVYLVPYRGYGKNDGEPTEKHLYADALAIFDQLKAQHQSISLVGRSLGSGVATYVAVNRTIEKLVLITPYDSIRDVAKSHYPYLPVSLMLKDPFLSIERAAKIAAPSLIFIAENDQVIPVKHSENLALAISPELLSRVVIKKAAHNDIMSFPEYAEAFQNFIE